MGAGYLPFNNAYFTPGTIIIIIIIIITTTSRYASMAQIGSALIQSRDDTQKSKQRWAKEGSDRHQQDTGKECTLWLLHGQIGAA